MDKKNYNDIKTELMQLPEDIKTDTIKIINKKYELENEKIKIELIKNNVERQVLSEKENEKPKFSNERSRDAEIYNRLNIKEDYLKSIKEIQLIEKEIQFMEVEIKHKLNLLSSLKYIIKLIEVETNER